MFANKVLFGKYLLGGYIGSGSFATVYFGCDLNSRPLAIKVIDLHIV